MKGKNILAGLSFVVIFFIAVILIPKSDKAYYELENYKRTIDSPISGPSTKIIEGKNFFGVQIGTDSNNYYAFTYQRERTPKQWISNYPSDFILVGDSIIKKAGNDTFAVKRGNTTWTYLLPKSFKATR